MATVKNSLTGSQKGEESTPRLPRLPLRSEWDEEENQRAVRGEVLDEACLPGLRWESYMDISDTGPGLRGSVRTELKVVPSHHLRRL